MGRIRFDKVPVAQWSALGNALGNAYVQGQAGDIAASVKPQTIESTQLTDTTPNTGDSVYDSDTGQYLPGYMDNKKEVYDSDTGTTVRTALGVPTEQAQGQMNGTGVSPEGLTPTFSSQTSKQYQLGGLTQATPFNPQQIRAEQNRKLSDFYAGRGDTLEATRMDSLSRSATAEGNKLAAGEAVKAGLEKAGPNLTDAMRNYKIQEIRHQTAINQGDYEGAQAAYKELTPARDAVMSDMAARANRNFSATGNPDILASDLSNLFGFVQTGYNVQSVEKKGPENYIFHMDNGANKEVKSVAEMQDFLNRMTNPAEVAKVETARMNALKTEAEKQNLPLGQATINEKKSMGKLYEARAEHEIGAKSELDRAKADALALKASGGGNGMQQQRIDAQKWNEWFMKQAGHDKNEMGVPKWSSPSLAVASQYGHSLIENGQASTPEQAYFMANQMLERASVGPDGKPADAATLNSNLATMMKRLSNGVPAQPAASSAAAAQPAAPAPKAKAASPAPSASPGLERAQPERWLRRGEPYLGKVQGSDVPKLFEEVINVGTGEVKRRPVDPAGLSTMQSRRGF